MSAAGSLYRDYISSCLYGATKGYFSKAEPLIQKLAGCNIKFNSITDLSEYDQVISEKYCRNSLGATFDKNNLQRVSPFSSNIYYSRSVGLPSWHTPSEIFSPFYGKAFLRCILDKNHSSNNQDPLIIYEIGPGLGSLAQSILDCLKESYPGIYKATEYHLVEISDTISKVQQSFFSNTVHKEKVYVHNVSALNCDLRDQRQCTIIATELLDNLPHDKIMYEETTGTLLQARIVKKPKEEWRIGEPVEKEMWEIATDDLILRYVAALDTIGILPLSLKFNWRDPLWRFFDSFLALLHNNNQPGMKLVPRHHFQTEFIPTCAFQLLETLTSNFPNHSLMLCDFSAFPARETIHSGHNSPLVQTSVMISNTKTAEPDFNGVFPKRVFSQSIFVKKGYFDIMFATDFEKLANIYRFFMLDKMRDQRFPVVLKHSEFLSSWLSKEEINHFKLKDGTNVLLEDFGNVKVLVC